MAQHTSPHFTYTIERNKAAKTALVTINDKVSGAVVKSYETSSVGAVFSVVREMVSLAPSRK